MDERKFIILINLLIQISKLLPSNGMCFNATEMVVEKIGLSDKQFWTGKSADLEQCVILCVRRKPCLSINYDSESHVCELNKGTRADTATKTGQYLMYSEYQSWPSSVDVNCFPRPCKDSEVCIPGSLADGSPDCSYACMKAVRDVCPMPAFGISNGRTVGSVNVFRCAKGSTGGGSARCLDTKNWDNEIDTTCTPIYQHTCTDNTLCSQIRATCSTNSMCECVGDYLRWDDTLKECVLDCQDPPDIQNAVFSGEGNTRSYVCNPDYHRTTGSVPTITCTETGWEPKNAFSCYKCPDPLQVAGAVLTGSGNVRQYVCNNDLYPIPGTGNGVIICTEENMEWEPAGFLCGGLRLQQGTSPVVVRPYSGYLEMFVSGDWKAVTHHSWTWQATKVACKKIYGFSYGGTFHEEWFDTNNQSPLADAIKLDRLACSGDEEALEMCTYEVKDSNIGDEIALTCFDYNFTMPEFEHVVLGSGTEATPGVSTGLLLVKIDGEFGAICGSDWSSKRTTVTCRSLNEDWTEDDECTDSCFGSWTGGILTNHVKCEGDEPHLFFCNNRGWGYDADCNLEKLVGIECITNVT